MRHTTDITEGRVAAGVHAQMNPHGVRMREARDSTAHPESLPVAVFYDVTGSMGDIPAKLQQRLQSLMGLLTSRHYVAHPQILMGAIGDAYSDRGPLQVGQFESGIEMDHDLDKIWVERGGGGTQHESYELAHYFALRHFATDAWDRRSKKGYLFTMGDEGFYDVITRAVIQRLIGDHVETDLVTADVVRELRERWNVFHIIVEEGSYPNNREIEQQWVGLIGADHVIKMRRSDNVAELIALTVGIMEGAVTLEDALQQARQLGADAEALTALEEALTPLATRAIRVRDAATV